MEKKRIEEENYKKELKNIYCVYKNDVQNLKKVY